MNPVQTDSQGRYQYQRDSQGEFEGHTSTPPHNYVSFGGAEFPIWLSSAVFIFVLFVIGNLISTFLRELTMRWFFKKGFERRRYSGAERDTSWVDRFLSSQEQAIQTNKKLTEILTELKHSIDATNQLIIRNYEQAMVIMDDIRNNIHNSGDSETFGPRR